MMALRRTNLPALALLLAALWALFAALPAAAEPTFPKLTGRVNDAAGVLPAETAAALEAEAVAVGDSVAGAAGAAPADVAEEVAVGDGRTSPAARVGVALRSLFLPWTPTHKRRHTQTASPH